jgi:hypothetical protein
MFRSVVCATLTVAIMPTPAFAVWEYTKWQMSRADVVSASGGRAGLATGGPSNRVFEADFGAESEHVDSEIKFTVEFYFNAKGLAGVKLLPVDAAQCEAAFMNLRRRLGKAHGRSPLGSELWHDRKKNHTIRAVDLRHESPVITNCHITYEPVVKKR